MFQQRGAGVGLRETKHGALGFDRFAREAGVAQTQLGTMEQRPRIDGHHAEAVQQADRVSDIAILTAARREHFRGEGAGDGGFPKIVGLEVVNGERADEDLRGHREGHEFIHLSVADAMDGLLHVEAANAFRVVSAVCDREHAGCDCRIEPNERDDLEQGRVAVIQEPF